MLKCPQKWRQFPTSCILDLPHPMWTNKQEARTTRDRKKPYTVRGKKLRVCSGRDAEKLVWRVVERCVECVERREGAHGAEESKKKAQNAAWFTGRASHPGGTAEMVLLAGHMSCMLQRTCFLGLDTSEKWLRLPSHRISTSVPIFPSIFGRAQPRWAV